MADVVRRRVRITGGVQGVFFRASTREVAQREGVTGWVQNMSDGSVQAELQGRSDAVQAVQSFCQHGPPGAQVQDVTAEDINVIEGESRFVSR